MAKKDVVDAQMLDPTAVNSLPVDAIAQNQAPPPPVAQRTPQKSPMLNGETW